MLEGLDKINWRSLRHSYGAATGTPAMLRLLISPDQEERDRAYDFLFGTINHQGDVMSATTAVIPFLIELLGYDETPEKYKILTVLMGFVASCNLHLSSRSNLGELAEEIETYRRVCSGKAIYVYLLRHSDDKLRFYATQLLELLPDQRDYTRHKLWSAIQREQHEVVLAQMIYTLGFLMPPHRYRFSYQRVYSIYQTALEHLFVNHHSQFVRVTAALTWTRLEPLHNPWEANYWDKGLPQQIVRAIGETFANTQSYSSEIEFFFMANYTTLNALARLGIYALAEVLSIPDLKSNKVHIVAREMIDQVFRRKSVQAREGRVPHYSPYLAWSEYMKFREHENFGDRIYALNDHGAWRGFYSPEKPLREAQIFVLATIVNNDLFWTLPTNLFSFFYGLPDDREALRELINSA